MTSIPSPKGNSLPEQILSVSCPEKMALYLWFCSSDGVVARSSAMVNTMNRSNSFKCRRFSTVQHYSQRQKNGTLVPFSIARTQSFLHTHTLTLTLTYSHSLSLTPSHSHSLSLTLTHSHSLSLTFTNSYLLTDSHSFSPTLTHFHSRSLTLTNLLSLSLSLS